MSYTLLSEVTRTARKAHRCIWCWQFIKPGDKYIDERSVHDGGIQHHRWHPECLEAMRAEAAEEGGANMAKDGCRWDATKRHILKDAVECAVQITNGMPVAHLAKAVHWARKFAANALKESATCTN